MFKGILVSSILASMLIFSGCGTDSEGVRRVTAQSMLDNGNYAGVIAKLESSSNLTSEQAMQLGSAYMGAAGLTLVNLTQILKQDDNTTTPQPSAFLKFVDKLRENAATHPRVLEYLDKAIEAFKKVLQKSDKNINARILMALSKAAKASTGINYLGDVKKLVKDGADNEMYVSACAMIYVYANSRLPQVSQCSDVSPASDNNTSDAFKEILITLSGGYEARRLTSLDGTGLILSNGYVDADGKRTTDSASGLNSAYPILGKNLTVQYVVLKALNSGFNTLIDIAPDDVKGHITNFKNELDADGSGTITGGELADYLIKKKN